jgi:hypothetical protein
MPGKSQGIRLEVRVFSLGESREKGCTIYDLSAAMDMKFKEFSNLTYAGNVTLGLTSDLYKRFLYG